MAIIRNINDLASLFETTVQGLDDTMSGRAGRDIYTAISPTNVRIGTFIGECNTEFNIVCTFPFESSTIKVFLDTIDHTCYASYEEAFDDPREMIMEMTEPYMNFSQDDAMRIMKHAEEKGWHIDPTIGWKDIVNIYNDLEPEEEE